MSNRTSHRRAAVRQVAEINRWYTSTIDGVTQGKVTGIEGHIITVEMSGGRVTEELRGGEFESCWETAL